MSTAQSREIRVQPRPTICRCSRFGTKFWEPWTNSVGRRNRPFTGSWLERERLRYEFISVLVRNAHPRDRQSLWISCFCATKVSSSLGEFGVRLPFGVRYSDAVWATEGARNPRRSQLAVLSFLRNLYVTDGSYDRCACHSYDEDAEGLKI